MDIMLARALVTTVHQQRTHTTPAMHDLARSLFTQYGQTPCEMHDLAWCSDCWHGPSPVTSERTSMSPTYGHNDEGIPLVNVDIRGWDTELVRGR